jgi:acyl-CoA thioester hydrolase
VSSPGNDHHFSVQVYYEDTDHSGVVYHPNFLKYFERAREHVLGIENLAILWDEQGLGFAVYKADITYHDGVRFGEKLDIVTRFTPDGDYRIIWHQEAWKSSDIKPSVSGVIQHFCL